MATLALNLAIGFAASFLSNLLAPSSTIKQEGPRLSDLSAPKSSYGASIPRVYGSVRVAGNLFWSKPIREVVTVTRQSTGGGGKGGGGGSGTSTYTYYGTFATLVAEGQIAGVTAIWANGKTVFNVSPDTDLDTYRSSMIFAEKLRIYRGTNDQAQDSLIAATQGASNTPAYRGRSYLVFDDLLLTDYGNRIPGISCEVIQKGYFDYGIVNGSQAVINKLVSSSGATIISLSAFEFPSTIALAVVDEDGHPYETGDIVVIAGATPAIYNGAVTVTVISETEFTYDVPGIISEPASGTITSFKEVATSTITATVNNGHPYKEGDTLTIVGATPNVYNGIFPIKILNKTKFTYTIPGGVPSPATGTISSFVSALFLYKLPTTIGEIAQDICSRVGFSLADLDTTEVDDIAVQGFWTNNNISARDALGQLQQAFFFDVIESGGKLRFIKQIRPGNPIAIPLSDLASYEYGQQRPDTFNAIRTQDTEILDEVSVSYLDVDFAYQQASQSAKRQISINKNKNDLKFDIVLTASEALAVAQKILYLGWAQRRTFAFTLPLKYAVLEPGDIVSISFFGGESQVIYILRINIGANFLLECEGIPYEPSLLALTAVSVAPAISLAIPNPSDTTLRLLDINLVNDTDTDLGIYVAATGNAAWRNAGLYVSRNNGDSYDFAKSLLTKTITGTCNNTLGIASEFTRDLGNSISITIASGELSSVSETDFMNGRNCALIGEEIIYFKNATLTAANTYMLSELLRGRRGTEWSISGHIANESFFFLSGYLERLEGQILDLNSQRLYKAPISTQTLADITATPFTTLGKSLKPYAPCQINGVRDGSNNLTISWVRRTRKGGMLVDYKDVDLSELSEAYEIDILSGSTVVRTLSSSTATTIYSTANQIADFGSPQINVNVRIYQLSGYVGRGYAGVATI